MKKTLLLIPLALGLGSSAWAGTCGMAALSVYDAAGFSCNIGDLTFSDFSYIPAASGGAISPPDSGVTVDPASIGGETGLEFTAAWLVGPDQTIDSSISFAVSTDNPGGITDADLVAVGGAGGTGVASVAELISGSTVSTGLFTSYAGGVGTPTDSTTFAPESTLSITKDIGVSGGTTGSGHLSDIFNLFSQGTTTTTPEPSLLILCTGLLGLVPLARRKLLR